MLDVAILAWPDTPDKVSRCPSMILNLTDKLKDGESHWTVPPGNWQVTRFVCTNNGQQLIAASPNSKGPFIDFLDPAATVFHFEHIIHKLGLKKGGDPACPLKALAVDSMELHPGIQWTPKFPEVFRKDHNYDPVAWLPVLTGWTIKDKESSDQFRYDYQKTVSDLLIFSHYTTGSKVCAEDRPATGRRSGRPGPADLGHLSGRCAQGAGQCGCPARRVLDQAPQHVPDKRNLLRLPHLRQTVRGCRVLDHLATLEGQPVCAQADSWTARFARD